MSVSEPDRRIRRSSRSVHPAESSCARERRHHRRHEERVRDAVPLDGAHHRGRVDLGHEHRVPALPERGERVARAADVEQR